MSSFAAKHGLVPFHSLQFIGIMMIYILKPGILLIFSYITCQRDVLKHIISILWVMSL